VFTVTPKTGPVSRARDLEKAFKPPPPRPATDSDAGASNLGGNRSPGEMNPALLFRAAIWSATAFERYTRRHEFDFNDRTPGAKDPDRATR